MNCSIEGCERQRRYVKTGWCNAHYARFLKHGDPLAGGAVRERVTGGCRREGCEQAATYSSGWCDTHYRSPRFCSVEGCESPVHAHGRCSKHYRQTRAAPPCTVEGCIRKQKARGWCQRHYGLFIAHGLHPRAYQSMEDSQSGRCAICRRSEETLHVDHDHKTGFVRGLLCHSCNVGLGFFHDDPGELLAAVAYLEQTTA